MQLHFPALRNSISETEEGFSAFPTERSNNPATFVASDGAKCRRVHYVYKHALIMSNIIHATTLKWRRAPCLLPLRGFSSGCICGEWEWRENYNFALLTAKGGRNFQWLSGNKILSGVLMGLSTFSTFPPLDRWRQRHLQAVEFGFPRFFGWKTHETGTSFPDEKGTLVDNPASCRTLGSPSHSINTFRSTGSINNSSIQSFAVSSRQFDG